MARKRIEVILVAVLAAALTAVHAGELYFLWGLRQAWGGDSGDPLVAAGAAIAGFAALLTWVFVVRGLRRAAQA